MVTASIVAPVSAILDKGITESAAGACGLWQSVSKSVRNLVTNPVAFVRLPQYRWLFGLYSLTYFSANASETVCRSLGIDHAMPQLAASTATNMSMSIAKDRAFARAFGTILPTALPRWSYVSWLARDISSMLFFFTLPPLLVRAARTVDFPEFGARFISPIAGQFVTTPFHILGLDHYNRRDVSTQSRLLFLKTNFPTIIVPRIMRIIPSYSFGGVCNASIRERFSYSQ